MNAPAELDAIARPRPLGPRLVAAERPVRTGDRVELVLLLAVLLLAALTPARDGAGGFNAPFKEQLDAALGGGICIFRRVTDIPCGGCGLTRAFVQLAHGELRSALALNPTAPLVFAWVVGKLVECAAFNFTGRRLLLGFSNAWRWRFYLALGSGVAALAVLRLGAAALGYPPAV